MYRVFLIFFILFFCSPTSGFSKKNEEIEVPTNINLEKIKREKNLIKHSLSELVIHIENSILLNDTVSCPQDLTEFEKLLCTARRIQHNDSQLVAIKFFKTLLEFECYRTPGEEMYLRLLLGNSLNYIGAPQIAKNYIGDVFPDIFKEINNERVKSNLLNSYASILMKVDSIEAAKKIYLQNLELAKKMKSKEHILSARNNLGFAYKTLGQMDSAKVLFKKNQNPFFKEVSPVLYAFSFGNYGGVLKEVNQYDSAVYYIKKEVSILEGFSSNEGLNVAYHNLAQIYEERKKLDSADFFYDKALHTSIERDELKHIVLNLESLMRIYAMKESTSNFGFLLSSYFNYQKQLNSEIRLKATKEEYEVSRFLDIFNEAEESKKKNDQLRSNNEELIKTIIVLGIVVFLLIIIITVRNINRRRLKAKNFELKGKNIQLEESYRVISESNAKNEVLLKELHHRVKNNLQIISSLFNLQVNASQLDLSTERVFKDAKNRIYSISLVHKKIYQSDNIDSLNFEEYIRDFSDELLKTTPNDVNIEISIQRNPISIDSAIPLGLIFNELFTNSLKHAKPHDSLKISVHYKKMNDKEKLIYTDNGVGVENIEVMKETGSSIGTTLIHLLGKQLDAKIEYKEAKEGEHGFWLSIEGNFE